jgi:hypothetical protein
LSVGNTKTVLYHSLYKRECGACGCAGCVEDVNTKAQTTLPCLSEVPRLRERNLFTIQKGEVNAILFTAYSQVLQRDPSLPFRMTIQKGKNTKEKLAVMLRNEASN